MQDKELCGAKAERELLKAQLLTVTAKSTSSSSAGNESSSAGDSPKGSPKGTAAEALQGGHIMPADESSQLHIVQEETKSLMNLANKMAAVMATSVGPVGDEIADILCEAQTLMGLARQEREAVTPEPDNSRNWEEMVQQKTANMMKEQKTQERMSKLANQLSETEDSYMHAMAESQKTLATAAVERDALLQLASKLEEQTRVQSEREGRVVEMFNHKCQELDALAQELKRVQENEARLLEERESLLSEVQEARRLESREQNKSESHMIESPKSQSPKSPPSLNRQSSWPNPIKWLMGDSKKKQDDDFSEPSGDEEEDDDEEEEEDSPVFEPEEGECHPPDIISYYRITSHEILSWDRLRSTIENPNLVIPSCYYSLSASLTSPVQCYS